MALSIPPGQFWGGNNGNWSTFRLILGTSNPQTINVLPSFLTSQIWVPTPPICNNATVLGTVSIYQCYTRRGGVYSTNNSAEAQVSGLSNLPISGRPAIFGTDNATIGDPPTITIGREIVAGYTTLQPFLGNFGLSGGESTLPWDTPANATSFGIVEDLWKQSLIGSRVWGCNVGASYRGVAASLTLGGFDANRGNEGGGGVLTVPMNADNNVTDGDLLVEVRGVGIGGGSPNFTTGLPVTAVVDSLVPDMFLPTSTCAYFEEKFGLVWDTASRRYFVNETQHDKLVALNASVAVAIGIPGGDANTSTTITLPYAAFDLNLSWPLNWITGPNKTLRYFPLQRADSDFYLGRAFLQEVYLAADYERRRFNISQAKWPMNGEKDIRMVVSSNTSTTVTPVKSHNRSGLSSGAATGIALGVVGVLAILGLLFWFMRKKRRAEAEKRDRQISRPKNIGSSSFGPRASTRVGTPLEKTPAFTQQRFPGSKPSPGPMTGVSASDSWRTTISGRHELSTPQTARFASPMSNSAAELPGNWKNPWTSPAVEPVELPAYESDRLLRRRSSSRDKF